MNPTPKIISGRSYPFAILLTESTDPLVAGVEKDGAVVTAHFSDADGGAAIDPTLSFTTVEKQAPAGYVGREYLGMIDGAATKPFFDQRIGSDVYLVRVVDGEIIGSDTYEVAPA